MKCTRHIIINPQILCQLFLKSNVTYSKKYGSQIWELIPSDIKKSPSLASFKLKSRKTARAECTKAMYGAWDSYELSNFDWVWEGDVG